MTTALKKEWNKSAKWEKGWLVSKRQARRCLLLVPEPMMIMHHGDYELRAIHSIWRTKISGDYAPVPVNKYYLPETEKKMCDDEE